MIMYKLSANYLSFTLFELTSNNINGLSKLDSANGELRGKLNVTSCLNTETGYIICLFVFLLVEPKDLYVRIYEVKTNSFSHKGLDRFLDRIYINTFLKIFNMKDEIGVYFIFEGDGSKLPKVYLKKLNNNKNNIENVIQDLDYIVPNFNGKYELDDDLFSSDAIKVSDTRFISV